MSSDLPTWITRRAPSKPPRPGRLLSRSLTARAAVLTVSLAANILMLCLYPVFAWVVVISSIPGMALLVMRTEGPMTVRRKLVTVAAAGVVVSAVLLLTPSHMRAAEEAASYDAGLLSGLYMFSITLLLGVLFVTFMSLEPQRFRLRYYALVMVLLIGIDVVVFIPERAPPGYESYALGALPAMWLFTVLIPISMLAYPGRYRSLPHEGWI